jgi:hypothetical protein
MKGDELDAILDQALASYAMQEPRAGLPGRVMARVQADGPVPQRLWWLLGFAAVGLTCLGIAMTMWRGETRRQPVSVMPPPMESTRNLVVPRHPEVVRPMTRVHARKHLPRRNSFPSPSPLTPEERALIVFVQQAPEAARHLAQPDKPVEIQAINIRPLHIDGLQTEETTGEIK